MPLDYKDVKLSTPTAIVYIADALQTCTNVTPENTFMFSWGNSYFPNKFERNINLERVQKHKNNAYTNLEILNSVVEELSDSYIDVNYFVRPAKTREYKIKVDSFRVYKKLPQIF